MLTMVKKNVSDNEKMFEVFKKSLLLQVIKFQCDQKTQACSTYYDELLKEFKTFNDLCLWAAYTLTGGAPLLSYDPEIDMTNVSDEHTKNAAVLSEINLAGFLTMDSQEGKVLKDQYGEPILADNGKPLYMQHAYVAGIMPVRMFRKMNSFFNKRRKGMSHGVVPVPVDNTIKFHVAGTSPTTLFPEEQSASQQDFQIFARSSRDDSPDTDEFVLTYDDGEPITVFTSSEDYSEELKSRNVPEKVFEKTISLIVIDRVPGRNILLKELQEWLIDHD